MRRVVFLASSLAVVLTWQIAAAAPLHYPLPPNSTARNGVPHQSSVTSLPDQPLAPQQAEKGLHPHAAKGLARRYAGTATDVLRYHNDNYPTGWNQSETDLMPAAVGSASFGKIATLNVDGNVLAQPLMVSNFTMPDNSVHNILIVATGHNTVYAYDSQTYDILWTRNLGAPQTSGDVGCNDIVPEYGISSTPVIVRSGANAATIYLVAATEPASFSFHTKLHALDLGTGADIMPARKIAPKSSIKGGSKLHFDPQAQWGRSALVYNNGSIYMGMGSHCDSRAGSISGWVLRYDAATLAPTGAFNTIEAKAGYQLSSVWMSGYSVALDPAGNVYAITGNGNYSLVKKQKGYGESVIALSPDLNKKTVRTFTPSNWASLNNSDTDFGSGGAMLIPVVEGQTAPPMIIGSGKAGTAYLLDASHLQGLEGSNGYQALQKISTGGCWCGPAYYGGPSGGIVYYQGSGDLLRAYSVATGDTPKLTQVAASTDGAGFGGSFPVISSNGTTAGTAVVWAVERGSPTEYLAAYDAVNMGDPLFKAQAGSWSNGSRAYLTPLVANGRVYVGAYKTVTVFGLTD